MKALKYLGLAALVAGISCSNGETRGTFADNLPVHDLYPICNVDDRPSGFIASDQIDASESDSVTQLAPDNFDATVLENKLPVVVKFYADWCGPCRGYKPIFEKVCAEYEGKLVCGAYDTDQDTEIEDGISDRYSVTGIPTTMFFHDGANLEERRFSGGRPEQILRNLFDGFLKECGH